MLRRISVSFLLVLFLAFVIRIIFLDRAPTGLSNDELDYILNAKSIFLSGSDISHTWNPFSLTSPSSSFPKAELASLMTFWLIGALPLGLLTSKIVYVLFSVATVGLIYLITKKLIGDKEAVIAGIVASFNPWLVFFGRTGYDTPLSIFFFLLALYLILVLKGWKTLLISIPLFLAFYTYIGSKILFLPFVIVLITFTWVTRKKDRAQVGILLGLSVLLVALTALSLTHSSEIRIGELATPNSDAISRMVNEERKLSIHSPVTSLLSNKYAVFFKYTLNKYLNAFSPNFLFITGDEKGQFSLWFHGVFYLADVFFLIVGSFVLFRKKKEASILLFSLVLISPLPSVMSTVGNSYAIRSMLMAPIFVIIIGVGVSYCIYTYRWSRPVIAILYGALFLNFINIYFLRSPLYNSESFNFSGRELAHYLSLQKSKVYVINGDPSTPFKQYLFYNNALTIHTQNAVASAFNHKQFTLDNITFLKCNDSAKIPDNSVVIYDDCKKISRSPHDVAITQLGDAGSVFTIKNDITCSSYALKRYPSNITFSDFSTEKLSEKQFCETFITRF